MPLGPEDVIRKSFKTSMIRRGYDQSDVDSFLEEVVADLRRRDQERDDLLAEAQRARIAQEGGAGKLARESEQLDLIRRERRELVAELEELTVRLTQVRDEIDAAKAAAPFDEPGAYTSRTRDAGAQYAGAEEPISPLGSGQEDRPDRPNRPLG